MKKGFRGLAVVLVAVVASLTLSACGLFKGDQAKYLAGDAGLACSIIPLQIPEKVPVALDALQCAKSVLVQVDIDTAAIARCSDRAGVPKKYSILVAAALQRVKAHAGSGPIVKQDSDAGRALSDFFLTCEAALTPEVAPG